MSAWFSLPVTQSFAPKRPQVHISMNVPCVYASRWQYYHNHSRPKVQIQPALCCSPLRGREQLSLESFRPSCSPAPTPFPCHSKPVHPKRQWFRKLSNTESALMQPYVWWRTSSVDGGDAMLPRVVIS